MRGERGSVFVHTKIGVIKQKHRRVFASFLDDVVEVVNSAADVNVTQVVGTQSGEPVVPLYNWATFLGRHFHVEVQVTNAGPARTISTFFNTQSYIP